MSSANVNERLINTTEMLASLPIGIAQLRVYIKDGRLPATKRRNKFYATEKDFNEFKLRLGF